MPTSHLGSATGEAFQEGRGFAPKVRALAHLEYHHPSRLAAVRGKSRLSCTELLGILAGTSGQDLPDASWRIETAISLLATRATEGGGAEPVLKICIPSCESRSPLQLKHYEQRDASNLQLLSEATALLQVGTLTFCNTGPLLLLVSTCPTTGVTDWWSQTWWRASARLSESSLTCAFA